MKRIAKYQTNDGDNYIPEEMILAANYLMP